jgi:AcrR family transcriptional regulator
VKKQAQRPTRERLLDAILEISRQEDLSGLSTTRVTRAVGVAQSLFYKYFDDMDDALAAAATRIAGELRPLLRTERQKFDPKHPGRVVRESAAATVDALLSEPLLARLLLRHQHDRSSPLGRTVRRLLARLRADLAADLRLVGVASVLPHPEIQAELILAMLLAIVDGLLDGRLHDREACLDTFAMVGESVATARLSTDRSRSRG